MNKDVFDKPDASSMPAKTADACAAVYIDVAEKLDAKSNNKRVGPTLRRQSPG